MGDRRIFNLIQRFAKSEVAHDIKSGKVEQVDKVRGRDTIVLLDISMDVGA